MIMGGGGFNFVAVRKKYLNKFFNVLPTPRPFVDRRLYVIITKYLRF